ncbi:hypothetical protein QIS74_04455 [Colletotrichum tabaci]|uniref:Integral membrane protein n=1 Tax=Colletotrichum tabaci TaxID=1209068 RepID=A0AAV9TJH4_9PEZI
MGAALPDQVEPQRGNSSPDVLWVYSGVGIVWRAPTKITHAAVPPPEAPPARPRISKEGTPSTFADMEAFDGAVHGNAGITYETEQRPPSNTSSGMKPP